MRQKCGLEIRYFGINKKKTQEKNKKIWAFEGASWFYSYTKFDFCRMKTDLISVRDDLFSVNNIKM